MGGASLSEILAREFSRLAEMQPEVTTYEGQAKFLNLSKGHLSRLRRGRVPLTTATAAHIASRLAQFEEHRRALEAELFPLTAESSASSAMWRATFVDAVRSFFASTGGNDLLCVEYRDLPRAEQDGQYPELALAAAEAVARGLTLALFQPFGYRTIENPRDADADLATYLNVLQRRVRRVYRQMADLAMKLLPPGQVSDKIVLYERSREIELLSGIQSRVFHLQDRGGAYNVWQWVVGADREYYIEWAQSVTDARAFRRQFQPVVWYWQKHGVLPNQNSTLDHAMRQFDASEGIAESSRGAAWTVYDPMVRSGEGA